MAPEGKQVAYLQGSTTSSSSFSQNLTSGQGGTWSITFSLAQGNGAKQGVVVTLNKTILGTIFPTASTYQTTTLVSNSVLPTGTYPLEFSVASATGGFVFIDDVKITVEMPVRSAPVFTSSMGYSGVSGAAFDFTVAATNTPTDFTAKGLPTGLTINSLTGIISGTTAETGAFSVTLTATNSAGTATQTFSLLIKAPIPMIKSPATATGILGSSFTYSISASNNPSSYGASGLPSGLTVNTSTGVISGVPNVVGNSTISLSAINSSGAGYETLTLAVSRPSTVSFSSWMASFTAKGTDGSATATPFNDGVPNLLKYYFDIDPSKPMSDRTALPVPGVDSTSSPGKSYLTLTYRQNPIVTGVSINVETSFDLKTWTPVVSPNLFFKPLGAEANGDLIMEVGVPMNQTSSAPTKQFICLSVTGG